MSNATRTPSYGGFEPAGLKPPRRVDVEKLTREAFEVYSKMAPLAYSRFDGREARSVSLAWCGALNLPMASWPLVDASLEYLQGRRITPGAIKAASARLLANIGMLREGRAIPLWAGSPPVWALVDVLAVREVEVWSQARQATVRLLRVQLLAHTGPLAGGVISVLQTPGYARTALKELGVPKYARGVNPAELFGMRSWSIIESAAKGGIAAKLQATPSQMKANKELYKARYYGRPDWCHRQVPCHQCERTTKTCKLACRSERAARAEEKDNDESER